MKPSQKLIVCFENYTVITRFEDIDVSLLQLAKMLELNGDKFGPVVTFDGAMCITIRYADKARDGIL